MVVLIIFAIHMRVMQIIFAIGMTVVPIILAIRTIVWAKRKFELVPTIYIMFQNCYTRLWIFFVMRITAAIRMTVVQTILVISTTIMRIAPAISQTVRWIALAFLFFLVISWGNIYPRNFMWVWVRNNWNFRAGCINQDHLFISSTQLILLILSDHHVVFHLSVQLQIDRLIFGF